MEIKSVEFESLYTRRQFDPRMAQRQNDNETVRTKRCTLSFARLSSNHPRMIQRSQITHFANAVAERFKPQRIVLFGSYAYGKPNQDSDVDLLVVMPEDRRHGRKAVEIREAINADFPLGLLVRTPEDIRWRLAEGDCFLQEVLSKGEVMYEAPHA